jgi:hypothetical protein
MGANTNKFAAPAKTCAATIAIAVCAHWGAIELRVHEFLDSEIG